MTMKVKVQQVFTICNKADVSGRVCGEGKEASQNLSLSSNPKCTFAHHKLPPLPFVLFLLMTLQHSQSAIQLLAP